jgi:hypothetical protein
MKLNEMLVDVSNQALPGRPPKAPPSAGQLNSSSGFELEKVVWSGQVTASARPSADSVNVWPLMVRLKALPDVS